MDSRRNGIYKYPPYKYSDACRSTYIVTGTCECPSVFNDIGDILRNELSPRVEPLPENIAVLKRMKETDSICINVRRGDFFGTQFQKSFGVCTVDFYRKAFEIINNQGLKNPYFFIVSDDIEWCRKNLKFLSGYRGKVSYISDRMPPYETMRLISGCKHFIISNSTFSWWGCYLSENKNKIVISPSRWNNDGYDSKLIGKDWILIDP